MVNTDSLDQGRNMNSADLREAATFLWHLRCAGELIDALPDRLRPQTLEDGYAIQDEMVNIARDAGQTVIGWKIAATSKAGQRHIGVNEPLAGRLFSGFLLQNGARLPAGPLHMRVAEAEFAFVMERDLPPRAEAYDVDEVRAAVADLHLAIEIPDARFERFAEIGPAQIAADDSFASWFVLGPKVHHWRELDLARQPAAIFRNGTVAAEGTGANALDGPCIALTWLANHLIRHGPGLLANDIVTTGTCVTPVEIHTGDKIVAEFPGLGQLAMEFI